MPALARATTVAGLPATLLQLPQGDQLTVVHHGAQVLSWVSGGRERLYLSPRSHLDGERPIRGGIPVCFPQFNLRGPLPKHGFVRQLPWTPQAPHLHDDAAHLSFALAHGAATRAYWDHAFEARLQIELRPGQLQVALCVHNLDARPLAFTGALHSYLAVQDIAQTALQGLAGRAEWDAVRDQHGHGAETLRFGDEFDRVYSAAPAPLTLHDGAQRLRIAQDEAWANTVVWNPGAARCAQMDDMPTDAWHHFVCVEAAQVHQPITIAPGEVWQAAQQLQLA